MLSVAGGLGSRGLETLAGNNFFLELLDEKFSGVH